MAIATTCFPLFIAQVWMLLLMCHSPVMTSTFPVTLNVTHTLDRSNVSGLLAINCSLDASLTNMDTVTSLTVLRSRSKSHHVGKDGFDQLAVVDMFSQKPRLVSIELESSIVIIKGKIGLRKSEQSYLMLSCNAPTSGQLYKCVAHGIDSNGQATSTATTEKVQFLGVDRGRFKTVNAIDRELQRSSIELGNASSAIREVLQQVQIVVKTTEMQNVKLREVLQSVQNLPNRFDTLEAKFMEESKIRRYLSKELQRNSIDKSEFDVSDSFRGSFYIVSKRKVAFNIGANQACQTVGGYLLEIDDDEEYHFVLALVKRIRGSYGFWTGGNDIDKEGTFVYINSKKLVPKLSGWASLQPDNWKGGENCMEIRSSPRGYLNDNLCSLVQKFVCEIPLHFKLSTK